MLSILIAFMASALAPSAQAQSAPSLAQTTSYIKQALEPPNCSNLNEIMIHNDVKVTLSRQGDVRISWWQKCFDGGTCPHDISFNVRDVRMSSDTFGRNIDRVLFFCNRQERCIQHVTRSSVKRQSNTAQCTSGVGSNLARAFERYQELVGGARESTDPFASTD